MSPVPNTAAATPMKSSVKKSAPKKSSSMKLKLEDMSSVSKMDTRYARLPNNAGAMKLFKSVVGLNLPETTTLSEIDENNKLCVTLDDEQYEWLNAMETELQRTTIETLKVMNPSYADSAFKSIIKVSEHTGKKYVKTKIQTLGLSRTIGADASGAAIDDCMRVLGVVGTKLGMRLRVDGAYAGKDSCGLVTKIDMFRIISIPDAEEIAEAKAKRAEDMEAKRMETLMDTEF